MKIEKKFRERRYIISEKQIPAMKRKKKKERNNEEEALRFENASRFLLDVWAKRECYLKDPALYTMKNPYGVCGTAFSGPMYFPVGSMLECWEHCPEFTLPDGSKVWAFGGGLSASFVETVNLETGAVQRLLKAPGLPIWQTLAGASLPYRKKAWELKEHLK